MRLVVLLLVVPYLSPAQPDSVIVTGQIRNLTGRLYREAPTVLVSRNNILQASRELVRPAPLNVDGTFRVALPLIYPQEEMYFTYGRISTPFLASAGTLRIDLNADSLFTASIPFQFTGVNAQVNTQFARYKAFEANYPNKPDGKKLSEQVDDKSTGETFSAAATAYQAPFRAFAAREKLFPLLTRWVGSVNRYNAASFVYDKVMYEGEPLPVSLTDSLRPADDQLLTAARASAMNRFGAYATQRTSAPEVNRANAGLSVRTLSSLLLRYGQNLTADEQARLRSYATDETTAKVSDLRFFERLVKRSNDTIRRLATYENMIRRSKAQFDSASVSYLTAYWLANVLPSLTLDFAKLLYSYARPQVNNLQLAQSLDELYRLEVQDSTRIRAAVQTLKKGGNQLNATEISSGVFVTRDDDRDGSALFDQLVAANRGKIVYVLLTSPDEEAGRQAALDAQRLRSTYRSRDLALLYVPMPGSVPNLWVEFSTKNNLVGDHLLLTTEQLSDILQRLRPDDLISAAVISRTGKIVKRNAPMPGAFGEARKVLDKNL